MDEVRRIGGDLELDAFGGLVAIDAPDAATATALVECLERREQRGELEYDTGW